MNSFGAQPL
jgi:hypothetical protein